MRNLYTGNCTVPDVWRNRFRIHRELLRSPYVDNLINSITYGVKMPRVGTETMTTLFVPIPPLAEQQRIVQRIEELLPLVKGL